MTAERTVWQLSDSQIWLDNVVIYHITGVHSTPQNVIYLYTDFTRPQHLFLGSVRYTADLQLEFIESPLAYKQYFTFPYICRTNANSQFLISYVDSEQLTKNILLVQFYGKEPKILCRLKDTSILEPPKIFMAHEDLACVLQIQEDKAVRIEIYSTSSNLLQKIRDSVLLKNCYGKISVDSDKYTGTFLIAAQQVDTGYIDLYACHTDGFGNVVYSSCKTLEVRTVSHSLIHIGQNYYALIYISHDDNYCCYIGIVHITLAGSVEIIPHLYVTQHTGITRINVSTSLDLKYLFLSYSDHRYEFFSTISIFEIVKLAHSYILIQDIELPITLTITKRDNGVVSITPLQNDIQVVAYTDLNKTQLLGALLYKRRKK